MSQVSYCQRHSKYFFNSIGCRDCGPRESLAELLDRESKLTARAIQRVQSAIASIDRLMLAAAALVTLVACGTEPASLSPTPVAVAQEVPADLEPLVAALVSLQLELMPELDMSRVRLVIVDSMEASAERCGSGVWACTSPSGQIVAPWDLTPSNWPASHGTVLLSARGISHELCHAYYFQRGDGDPEHAHDECFGDDSDSVVSLVSTAFADRHGDAAIRAVL